MPTKFDFTGVRGRLTEPLEPLDSPFWLEVREGPTDLFSSQQNYEIRLVKRKYRTLIIDEATSYPVGNLQHRIDFFGIPLARVLLPGDPSPWEDRT